MVYALAVGDVVVVVAWSEWILLSPLVVALDGLFASGCMVLAAVDNFCGIGTVTVMVAIREMNL